MIDKKNILIEKHEFVNTIYNMMNSNHKFIFDKRCVCEINYNQITHKQSISFCLIYHVDEITLKDMSSLIEARNKAKAQKMSGNDFFIIEQVLNDTVDIVPKDHIIVQVGAWVDSKEFIGLILGNKIREQLNNMYKLLIAGVQSYSSL